ncbi:armadillo-type protein [Mycena rebaudengoi]|nr:armadillo-type protein [Mycena rebaudengoi]
MRNFFDIGLWQVPETGRVPSRHNKENQAPGGDDGRFEFQLSNEICVVSKGGNAKVTDSDVPQVVDGALWVLSRVPYLKYPPVTAGVSVEAKLLDHIVDMLKAPNTAKWHYRMIFQIISHLVFHNESNAIAVVEANVLTSVEKLLRSRPTAPYRSIFRLLENLVSHEATAMAVVRMLPLDLLGTFWRESFEDTAPIDVLASQLEVLVTTKLLSAQHKATAEATCGSLVALVCDSDMPQVVDGALRLLSCAPHLKFPPVTTGVSIEAKLLDHIVDMLDTPSPDGWRYMSIFQMLSNLVLHGSTAAAVVEANMMEHLGKQLKSPTAILSEQLFGTLHYLLSHESTATAVLDMGLYDLLMTLWSEDPQGRKRTPSGAVITSSVIHLLTCMARRRDGAEGVVTAAKCLESICEGFQSSNRYLRLLTCELLRELVGHESMVQAVVAIVPREDIVAVSSGGDYWLRQSATETLLKLDATLERLAHNSRNQ